MTDEYGSVTSKYYDGAYRELRDSSGDTRWYRHLAQAADGPVLELGCGTGRVLLPIAQDGVECVGLDASSSMLDAFRAKQPPATLSLVCGRMQDFDLGNQRFALIFSAFRVFQHLYTVDDQVACLNAVRRHLAPGGAFAFDVFVPRFDSAEAGREEEAEDGRFEQDGETIVRYASSKRNRTDQMVDVKMRYERQRDGAVLSNERVEFRMRYFYRYELEHLLHRAGFEDLTMYGDFDETPFGPDATSFAVVARTGPAS
jgi:SAM-dependent methyltransferase